MFVRPLVAQSVFDYVQFRHLALRQPAAEQAEGVRCEWFVANNGLEARGVRLFCGTSLPAIAITGALLVGTFFFRCTCVRTCKQRNARRKGFAFNVALNLLCCCFYVVSVAAYFYPLGSKE